MRNIFRSKIRCGCVFLIVLLVGSVAGFPLKAQACTISKCGVTQTYANPFKLSANLYCDETGTPAIDLDGCGGPQVVDCQFHTISGGCTGSCLTEGGEDYVGISSNGGNIEVKNCIITKEQDAVSLSNAHAQIDGGVFIWWNYIGVDLECVADAKLVPGSVFIFNHTDVNTLSLTCE